MVSNLIDSEGWALIQGYFQALYPETNHTNLTDQLKIRLEDHISESIVQPKHQGPLSHRDTILIAYPDHVQHEDYSPMKTLHNFLNEHIQEYISGVHILPFFPYSSDDGFSVIDFCSVDPTIGDWKEIRSIAQDFRLMVDLVLNHISTQSEWFQSFLNDIEPFTDYFIRLSPDTELSKVVRPRDFPILTPFETAHGREYVWTTFSADQVDLNYQNPSVLFEMLDVLLYYIRNGAQIIRLDAVAFLWKEPGSSSIHLPQTHTIVKLLRYVLSKLAPWVFIITETNVPHDENLSYFGHGHDEAHLVYQFALPPLTLHALLSGDAAQLTSWASDLSLPSKATTFFNFLASHDGIGLRAARDLLDAESYARLLEWTEARKGFVSYRQIGEGHREPYELNITLFDALATDVDADIPSPTWIRRYITAQAIMLSLKGVPGIYFHSLFGGRNFTRGVNQTGQKRTINREKFELDTLGQLLSDPSNYSSEVFERYRVLLRARQSHTAFDPYGEQHTLFLHPSVFALLRRSPGEETHVLCLHNVSERDIELVVNHALLLANNGHDLLHDEMVNTRSIRLKPYQSRWIAFSQPN